MLEKVLIPDQISRARLIGRGGAKKRDIETVSGATLSIRDKEVLITASDLGKIDLAKRLICKCIEHGRAANQALSSQFKDSDSVRKDLIMAAHYTYRG